jgi:hypothetical protein
MTACWRIRPLAIRASRMIAPIRIARHAPISLSASAYARILAVRPRCALMQTLQPISVRTGQAASSVLAMVRNSISPGVFSKVSRHPPIWRFHLIDTSATRASSSVKKAWAEPRLRPSTATSLSWMGIEPIWRTYPIMIDGAVIIDHGAEGLRLRLRRPG